MGVAERKEREKLKRRQDIIDAACTVLSEKGFASATVDDVSERVELAKGTIYLYFQTKEELFMSVFIKGLDNLLEKYRETADLDLEPADMLERLALSFYRYYKEDINYIKTSAYLLHEDIMNKIPAQLTDEINQKAGMAMKIIRDVIQRGIDKGDFADVDSRRVARILWGLSIGIAQTTVMRIHLNVPEDNVKDLLISSFNLVKKGLLRNQVGT
ncbi:MAG: TetR/AcrR family transcriptional regulator [Thermodesulfobacteriota bacterium]|nr:TetR/AcrR family transcriptional regulator [Thermodesulfobacteriota bacterium]